MPLNPRPTLPPDSHFRRPPARHVVALLALWLAIFFAALWAPPLLDDADATHAQAARAMVVTGDWVTLHVDGIRYLEKPPLPYWLVALSFRDFGFNTFAVHFPLAFAVLALAALGYLWGRRAFNTRTAFYTALATLTCTGVFLFTRIFIPEVLLSLFLCTALYAFLRSLEPDTEPGAPRLASETWVYPYTMWTALAFAVLTKGLIALVFFFGATILYLALTGEYHLWRRLRPFSGVLLFLLIAAPWHILASLRNTGGEHGHGFAWFYFINEHVLRFLGRRIPRDYNKLPGYLYWSLHLVWLFPWSLFAPLAAIRGWKLWRQRRNAYRHAVKMGREEDGPDPPYTWTFGVRWTAFRFRSAVRFATNTLASRTILLLTLYSTLILVFFSLSTNQEYYTFPIYLPLLMLICAALANAERTLGPEPSTLDPASFTLRRWLLTGHIAYTVIGLAVAAALAYGLWSARNLAFVPDIGDLLAHRGVGDYTLSMSHFFDLTGSSFAALRLPASLALVALALGPAAAWTLRHRREHFASTVTVALTSALFLIAAHIALDRFSPMLSSKDFAERIEELRGQALIDRDNEILLFGDQSYGSSIPFYLDQQVKLVDGRSSSMLFGSTFADAPHIFLTSQDLLAEWGQGRRKILFVPLEKADEVNRLLGPNQVLLEETSGKLLITDRPLNPPTIASYR
jgi:4-amino-4-deoxy-L-arabinose transferase-like glycosyltransferase